MISGGLEPLDALFCSDGAVCSDDKLNGHQTWGVARDRILRSKNETQGVFAAYLNSRAQEPGNEYRAGLVYI